MTDLAHQIHAVLAPASERELMVDAFAGIRRAHDLLEATLKRLVPSARVQVTDYFNHTIFPDAILHFPDETSRYVFLVTQDPADPFFADWIDYTGGNPSIFICLGGPLDRDPVTPGYELAGTRNAEHCLIVAHGGLAVIGEHPNEHTELVLRHGNGLLDAPAAQTAAAGDTSGLVSAEHADLQLRL